MKLLSSALLLLICSFGAFAASNDSTQVSNTSGFAIKQPFYLNAPALQINYLTSPLSLSWVAGDEPANALIIRQPDYMPPRQAIFCRFENTLGRTFGLGVRLRVEIPNDK